MCWRRDWRRDSADGQTMSIRFTIMLVIWSKVHVLMERQCWRTDSANKVYHYVGHLIEGTCADGETDGETVPTRFTIMLDIWSKVHVHIQYRLIPMEEHVRTVVKYSHHAWVATPVGTYNVPKVVIDSDCDYSFLVYTDGEGGGGGRERRKKQEFPLWF